MPIKNKARPTQSGFEGEIVGLNDNERKIIREEIGNSDLEGYAQVDKANIFTETQTFDGTLGINIGKVHLTEAGLTELEKQAEKIPTIETKTNNAIPSSQKGANNGVAELDATGKVPSSQLPSYVDDVIEVANYEALPNPGESSKIYLTLDTNLEFRWSGSTYAQISKSLALGETASTAYAGDKGKKNADDIAALTTNVDSKYVKPSTGIPKTDLANDVQTTLDSVVNKIDKSYVDTEVEDATKDVVKYQSFQNPNDDAPRKTIQLANHDTISGVSTTGTAHNLIMLSKWDKVDVGAAGVTINLNGKDARPTYNDEKEIALVEDLPDISSLVTKEELEDELQFKPVICNMNFRTLSDKVYTQDEIFAWFFVKDIFELKNTIIKHPIYLRYGISLSTNPMYYYIPCQYVAFTDANTVEMITDGLDTKNDKFSRYHITIKLDGTVINGKSNIKVELKENVFVPDLPEDSKTKTYTLKAVNGVLTRVNEEVN